MLSIAPASASLPLTVPDPRPGLQPTPVDGYAGSTPSTELSPASLRALQAQVAMPSLSARLQSRLGLNAEQADRLAALGNKPYAVPYQAGRLEGGEVFLVTIQDTEKDPAGFQGNKALYHVYFGQPDQLRELPVADARHFSDGGSTFLTTEDKQRFAFPIRDAATVGGQPLRAHTQLEEAFAES